MRVIDLALKDLKQIVRDWKSAFFLVAMPVIFTLLLGFVFRDVASGGEDPRLPVGWLDQDGSAVCTHLGKMLQASEAIRLVDLESAEPDTATEQVADGDLAAAVVCPPGYGRQALSPDEPLPEPIFVFVPGSQAGHTAQSAVQAGTGRLASAIQTARLSAQALADQGGAPDEAYRLAAMEQAVVAWQDPPLGINSSGSGMAATEEEEIENEASPYAHSSAGIMVQFAMAGLMGAAGILVVERKTGSLRRLLTTAISRMQIIVGHYLAMAVMIVVQLFLLILFGQLILGVDYFAAPLATLLIMLTTALWSASLGLLIGIVAHSEEQVIMIALVLMLVLSGLGGAWMPLELTSETFQMVGHLTPVAWAVDGFENIVIRGMGLASVLAPAAILLGWTIALFAASVWRFRFE
ncbi:MAG: ABC transporter permease [Anaerolineae bacterium]|jgi:ABC-2 type transport system permease protein